MAPARPRAQLWNLESGGICESRLNLPGVHEKNSWMSTSTNRGESLSYLIHSLAEIIMREFEGEERGEGEFMCWEVERLLLSEPEANPGTT